MITKHRCRHLRNPNVRTIKHQRTSFRDDVERRRGAKCKILKIVASFSRTAPEVPIPIGLVSGRFFHGARMERARAWQGCATFFSKDQTTHSTLFQKQTNRLFAQQPTALQHLPLCFLSILTTINISPAACHLWGSSARQLSNPGQQWFMSPKSPSNDQEQLPNQVAQVIKMVHPVEIQAVGRHE